MGYTYMRNKKDDDFIINLEYDAENDDYIFEYYDCYIKYPKVKARMSCTKNFKILPYLPKVVQIFQWLLCIASTMREPATAKRITIYALEHWYRW